MLNVLLDPSAPPQKIEAKITDDGILHLSWSPPPERHFNGRLTEYKVEIKSVLYLINNV